MPSLLFEAQSTLISGKCLSCFAFNCTHLNSLQACRIKHELANMWFTIFLKNGHSLTKVLRNVWVTTVAIPQQPEKSCGLTDLSHSCRFGETLLTLSRVVDTSMIYLCRHIVAVFVAITSTNKSGHFSRRHSVARMGN